MTSLIYYAVIWGGIAFAICNAVFIGVLIIHRYLNERNGQLRTHIEQTWSGVLESVRDGEDVNYPDVTDHGHRYLLPLWTSAYEEATSDQQRRRLLELAGKTGLETFIERRFQALRGSSDHQVVLAIGFLRKEEFMDPLEEIAREGNALLSIVAARALAELEPSRVLERITPLLHKRNDWPLVHVRYIISKLDTKTATRQIPPIVHNAPQNRKATLVSMLGWIQPDVARTELRKILTNTDNDEVRAAVLREYYEVGQTKDRKQVRPFLYADAYFLRAHAARVFGRIGTGDDVEELIRKTSDENYWVRYRSAQALAGLPGVNRERLCEIRDSRQDQFARDILQQVIEGKADQ